jgi:hypothetical protein
MSVPPEVLFDRYFQTLYPSFRRDYKGKQDLDLLEPPEFKKLLLSLQEVLTRTLNDEPSVPEHVDHPPFHLDYINSSKSNALAFRYERYSFVGITVPLILSIWDACVRLSRSEEIALLLGVQIEGKGSDALRVVLFRAVIFFVVTHEYTHHVHGHVAAAEAESMPRNEILDDGPTGDLTGQTFEADADAYAAVHLMANLIGGSARSLAIGFLKLDASPASVQDQVLFSCIAVAVGTFLLLRPVGSLDKKGVYTLTHPPQAARMGVVMRYAINWCKQHRPELGGQMTPDRFNTLMKGAADVFWAAGDDSQKIWVAQTEFLQSPDGIEYLLKLQASLKKHIASL